MRQLTAALLFLFAAFLAAPAQAQDGPKILKAATQASKEFETYLAKTLAAKQVPNFQTPLGAQILAKVFDVKTIRALPPTGGQDLPWLVEWLGAVNTAYTGLINFGADPKSENYMQTVAANVDRYEGEIAQGFDMLMRLFARVSNATTAYIQSLPEAERNQPARQKSLAGVRGGYVKSYTGAIQFAADDVKPAAARLTTLALRDTAKDFAAALNAEQRTELADLATRAAAETKDAETRDNFTAIAQAIAAK